MGKLVFDVADVRKIYKHAKAAKHWRTNFEGKPCAGQLWLVHDRGVYLMSPGIPHLERPGAPERSFVAYAEGTHPKKDEAWWDVARELAGGDDFVEDVPLEMVAPALERADLTAFSIVLTNTQIKFDAKFAKSKPTRRRTPPELEDIV